VIAGDIDPHGLESLEKEFGTAIVTQLCDVTQEDDVAQLCTFGKSAFGKIDIVVANAGAGTYGLITELPLSEWKRIIDLCLTGVFLTLKHGGAAISDGGSIINIASLNAIQPSRGMSAYCAAKAGVSMLTQVSAMELGPRGIRVNTIAPGLVETNATSGMFAVPVVIEEFVENATLSRFAQPTEIASVASFLASDESSYMSASFVSVDGGGNTGRYPNLPRAFGQIN
jgi:NAD(P)-dependent dehydrogenase (short-subunit alcohol dehydrogenase family)